MSVRKIAAALGVKKMSAFFNYTRAITVNQKQFKVPILNNMGFMNLEISDDFFLKLFKSINIKDNECFVDIGVNVGQTMIKFRSCRNTTYYGFEPNPGCVYYLKSLIEINNFRDTTVVPVGLAAQSTVAKFYKKGSVDAAGTIVNELRPDYYSAEEVDYVPVFALDSLEITGNKRIALIKIDVEGAESEVLSGMTGTIQKNRPVILCEILDSHSEESLAGSQARADKVVALIKSLNYKIYRVVHEGTKITPEEISEVKLKKWVPESWNLNDYLFVPSETPFNTLISL